MKLRPYHSWRLRRPVRFDEFTEEFHFRMMSGADQLLRFLNEETPAFLLKFFHPFREHKYTARGEVVFVECAILHHHLLDMDLHRMFVDSDRERIMKKIKEFLFDDISEFGEGAREQLSEYKRIMSEYPAYCLDAPNTRILVPPAFHVFAVRVEELVNHSPWPVEFAICRGANCSDLFSFRHYLYGVELREQKSETTRGSPPKEE